VTEPTLPVPRFANLSFVTPNLAIGGDISQKEGRAAEQLADLGRLGVTHVVDCRGEWNDALLFRSCLPDIDYLHHGMDDAGQRVPMAWFETAITWIEAAGPDAVVLTHCHMGINRGPSLGFAVLLSQGWDPVDAISAIRAARPIANVWYADDALRWHHARRMRSARDDLARLAAWRAANPLDVVRIIREQRASEAIPTDQPTTTPAELRWSCRVRTLRDQSRRRPTRRTRRVVRVRWSGRRSPGGTPRSPKVRLHPPAGNPA
jgi:dual specificity phosphatase 3